MNEEENIMNEKDKMSEYSSSQNQSVPEEDKKGKKLKFKKENKEEELQKKVDDLNDKYLRLFAEFDNYRKRTIKEKAEIITYASEDLITSLLPVLDDFDRAVSSFGNTTDVEPIKEGILLINNKLKTLLEQKGLNPIESKGNDFSTDFHEAITSIDAPEEMKGKVVDEIQKGYTYKGKIIRYAKVVVGN